MSINLEEKVVWFPQILWFCRKSRGKDISNKCFMKIVLVWYILQLKVNILEPNQDNKWFPNIKGVTTHRKVNYNYKMKAASTHSPGKIIIEFSNLHFKLLAHRWKDVMKFFLLYSTSEKVDHKICGWPTKWVIKVK